MKKIYSFLLPCLFLSSLQANAQSDPTPFDLASGNYTFTEWASTELAGTYPANMVFHFTANPTGSNYNPVANGSQDFACSYSLTSRPRVNGQGENGLSMTSTGDPQYNDCSNGSATGQRYTGAAVLALNTTGRENIELTWTGGTLIVGDGGDAQIPRIFAFQLQYRIGNTGDYTNVADGVYISDVADHTSVITSTLPSECNGQEVVQVRWIYQQHSSTPEGAQGTRPTLRLDDIMVTSEASDPTSITDVKLDAVTVHPNPSSTGIFMLNGRASGAVYDVHGRMVKATIEGLAIDLGHEPSGQYFLRTDEGQVIRLVK